jgi:two-component system, LytTR family, sensor kinase
MGINRFHIVFWLLYCIFVSLIDYLGYGEKFKLSREVLVLFLEIWVFYTILLTIFSLKNTRPITLLKAVGFLCLSLAGSSLLCYFRIKLAAYYGIVLFPNTRRLISDFINFYIQFGFYAIGYFYAYRFGIKQKQLMELEKKQAEYEKAQALLEFHNIRLQADLMQSENNFLRSQINPHFLYNCLNFMYSKTFRQQPQVAEAIMLLSQVMRYSLSDFSVTNGLANLGEEMLHINNVIKINRFRFNDSLQIQFEVIGNPDNKMIAPMLLITLVENVFKHGQLQDANHPALMTCHIDEGAKRIRFSTWNKKTEAVPGNLSSGVGYSNIRQRLHLLYKSDFGFMVKDEGGAYQMMLEIPYFDSENNKGNNITEQIEKK